MVSGTGSGREKVINKGRAPKRRPATNGKEAMRTKMRAMRRLARETAQGIRGRLERDVRMAIHRGVKDDPDLRAIGLTEQEANALVTVTMRLISEG